MTEHVAVYIELYHFVFTIFTISIKQLRQGRKYVYKKQTLCLFIRKTCVIQSNISYAFTTSLVFLIYWETISNFLGTLLLVFGAFCLIFGTLLLVLCFLFMMWVYSWKHNRQHVQVAHAHVQSALKYFLFTHPQC